MPRKIIYTCKVCGQQKQQTNRWFVSQGTRVGYHLMTWEWAVAQDVLDDEDIEYICGQSCAHKLLDGFLGETLNG